MIVTVTKEDIEKGIPKNEQLCPIARAIRRQLPDSAVYVGSNFIDIDELHYDVTEEIENFIWNFDAGREVKPFTFETEKLSCWVSEY